MLPENKVIISVVVDVEVKEVLKKYSKELDISVSRLAKNFIYVGLKDYKIIKNVNLDRAVAGFREMLEFQTNTKENNLK